MSYILVCFILGCIIGVPLGWLLYRKSDTHYGGSRRIKLKVRRVGKLEPRTYPEEMP